MIPSQTDMAWLPKELRSPGRTGSSNTRCAYFADNCRPAIDTKGRSQLDYAGDAILSGFSRKRVAGQQPGRTSQVGALCGLMDLHPADLQRAEHRLSRGLHPDRLALWER